MAKLVADYVQLRQKGISGSSVDPNGPNAQLLAQLDKAFQPFLSNLSSDPQTSDQAAMAAPVPTPYSTDGISPDVQSNPMSQLPPDELNRIQNFSANSAMLANNYGDVSNLTSGNVVVRDHRHPVGSSYPPAASPVGYYPPPTVTAGPVSSGSGASFTSAADYNKVDQLNSNFQAAKQDALDHPDDPSKQIAFQDAAQALQLLVNMLLQISQMLASIADKAISNSKVNPS